ncbi:DUF6042 family protein [Streptomyces sp. NPDC032161]|uniref:DUF6042 family protein n=1 Tax=unclassified Streptomyces TaxID=2593676 RepID=UPI003400979B
MSLVHDTSQHDNDSYLSLHSGWFASGWPSYLPQHQAMMLSMLFGTATVRGLRGSLDDVLEQIYQGEPGAFFGNASNSLDSPVVWMDPDELEYAETEQEKNQLRVDAEEHQARCEELLRTADLAVPTTIRELADTMLALGIASQQDGVWSMPDPIPGPETALALTDKERAAIAYRRQFWESGPAEQTLIDYLTDDLNRPAEVFTSVDRLAKATDLSEDDLRNALGRLTQEGEARLERGTAREQTALEALKGHERFHLVLNWPHFDENRITIERG